MIVSLSSVRGSPGVTSWSLLLAAAWPVDYAVERVVLEADCDGGVLGARYGFGVDPGAVSLIATLRRADSRALVVSDHGRRVNDGVWVIPGPETGERAARVWSGSAATVAAAIATDDRAWFVDAGRADAASPVAPLLDLSAIVLLLTRSATEDLVQVPARVEFLRQRAPSVCVLVIGKPQHSLDDLAGFFGVERVWTTGADENLVRIAGEAMAGGRARRSWVWRSAISIAADIAAAIAGNPTASNADSVEHSAGGIA
jgi:MinD-like ATPase involved in chromosome partitioning or flagellar assembly